jgi:CheY-like chemotaxis protein
MKKIFVADDDRDILDILSMMLSSKGYKVHATINALDIFDETTELPDIILLDIWMSGLDGRDVFARLKETDRTKHIPVIFISANSRLAEITAEHNADGFIAKPFEMNQLFEKVQEVLLQKTGNKIDHRSEVFY